MQLQPLSFRQTLDKLGEWKGREVNVSASTSPPGEALSHSQLTQRGRLGPVQMVDNHIDPNTESVAAYEIEGTKGGIYISPEDFLRAVELGAGHLKISFKHHLDIQVRLV